MNVLFGATTDLADDAVGRLAQATTAETARKFLYDGAEVIAEYNANNDVIKRYVRGPGADEVLVEYDVTGTANKTWLVADERGSIIAGVNGSGATVFKNTYDEYGLPALGDPAIPGSGNQGRFQYTGQMYLKAIGIYHYKARTYQPQLGRFMQTDPLGFADGLNLYNYVGGDPINFADPTGLLCIAAPVIGGGNDACLLYTSPSPRDS